MHRVISMLAIVTLAGQAQTQIDLRTQAKNVDFSSATSTKPFQTGTTLPATCQIGEAFFKTDAPSGKNIYGCTTTNSWTLQGPDASVMSTNLNNLMLRGQTVAGSRDEVQLDITGNTAQTAPLFRVRTSTGNVLIQANQDGSVNIGSGNGPTTIVNQAAPSTPPTSQTGIWADSTNKGLWAVDDAGNQYRTVVPYSPIAHHFVTGLGLDGTFSHAQPAAADISGLTASATTDTTNAANISSGILPPQRLPSPGGSSLGGVQSKDCSAGGQFLQKINTDGSVTCATVSSGSSVPPATYFMPMLGVSNGIGVLTQNQVKYGCFALPYAVTFGHIEIKLSTVDSNSSNLYDLFIASAASSSATTATIVAHTGPIALTSASGSGIASYAIAGGGTTTVPAGKICTGWTTGAATPVANIGYWGFPALNGYTASTTTSSAGTAPGTINISADNMLNSGTATIPVMILLP